MTDIFPSSKLSFNTNKDASINGQDQEFNCVYHVQISKRAESVDKSGMNMNRTEDFSSLPVGALFRQTFAEIFADVQDSENPQAEIFPETAISSQKTVSLYVKWYSEPHPFIMRVLDKMVSQLNYEIQWIKILPDIPDPKKDSVRILKRIEASIDQLITCPELESMSWVSVEPPNYFEYKAQKRKNKEFDRNSKDQITQISLDVGGASDRVKSSLILRMNCRFICKLGTMFSLLQSELGVDKKGFGEIGGPTEIKESEQFLSILKYFHENPQSLFSLLCNLLKLQSGEPEMMSSDLQNDNKLLRGNDCALNFATDLSASKISLEYIITGSFSSIWSVVERAIMNHIICETSGEFQEGYPIIFRVDCFRVASFLGDLQ